MLILRRREGQRIRIGDDITLIVAEIGRGRVVLAFDAPKDVMINREELILSLKGESNEHAEAR